MRSRSANPSTQRRARPSPADELPLAQTILDHQVVDIDGRRVVRVNDLEIANIADRLRLVAVDVGSRGLLRRLGLERPAMGLARLFGRQVRGKAIAWDNVHMVGATAHPLQLTLARDRAGGPAPGRPGRDRQPAHRHRARGPLPRAPRRGRRRGDHRTRTRAAGVGAGRPRSRAGVGHPRGDGARRGRRPPGRPARAPGRGSASAHGARGGRRGEGAHEVSRGHRRRPDDHRVGGPARGPHRR